MTLQPKTITLISLALCLPTAILFAQVRLGIEASLGPPDPLLQAGGGRLGSVIAPGLFLLLPVAFGLNLAAIRRGVRAGDGLAGQPVNLLLAAAVLALMAAILGSVIVDQYPCWAGVPNCDETTRSQWRDPSRPHGASCRTAAA